MLKLSSIEIDRFILVGEEEKKSSLASCFYSRGGLRRRFCVMTALSCGVDGPG